MPRHEGGSTEILQSPSRHLVVLTEASDQCKCQWKETTAFGKGCCRSVVKEGLCWLMWGMLVAPWGFSSPPGRDFLADPCVRARKPWAARLPVLSSTWPSSREGSGICWGACGPSSQVPNFTLQRAQAFIQWYLTDLNRADAFQLNFSWIFKRNRSKAGSWTGEAGLAAQLWAAVP